MRRIPTDRMKAMYDRKKKETVKKIAAAIDDLQDAGQMVTKKALMDATGLASSTFSQPHVIELLKRRRVCQFESHALVTEQSDQARDQEIRRLLQEVEKLKNRNSQLADQNNYLRNMIERRIDENAELKRTLAQLRGRYQMCLERMDNAGILPRENMISIVPKEN